MNKARDKPLIRDQEVVLEAARSEKKKENVHKVIQTIEDLGKTKKHIEKLRKHRQTRKT